ncbi:hypothetical protein BKA00_004301 [Actinomadura coerulea]|uniref:AbiJ-NTD3 domain-containing protein n=1 Tax=Actinomadura coerulea TaxID=46159 RepID=A0A7X0G243_9ACTN|nr:hypothetical protein [Actinomadura coerulea]MBB6397387.1 hypothetical protein [Actinomadura coerulea]
MHPDAFFEHVSDDERYLDLDLLRRLRKAPLEDVDDVEAAHGLSRLVCEVLKTAFGDGRRWMENDESREVLRTLRVVLRRVGIPWRAEFRDIESYRYFCEEQGFGEWDPGAHIKARGLYLHRIFDPILDRLEEIEDGPDGAIRGVDGELKNIIFASVNVKPRIVLRDALENRIEIVEGADDCLIYDRPLSSAGVTWGELIDWWRMRQSLDDSLSTVEVGRDLYGRLGSSLDSPPEERLLKAYCADFPPNDAGVHFPALLPQVYLHYDPYTRRQRRSEGKGAVLVRERMDFLMLLPGGVRVVLEIDGKQHYAEKDTASPRLYAEMVAEDRELRLYGYEVYRFGGYELRDEAEARDTLRAFFTELLRRHGVAADESRNSGASS